MRLENKIALITGAASGIGFAVAKLFTREGATVFAADSVSPASPYPPGIETLELDGTLEDDWCCAIDKIVEKTGRLDVLINCGGIHPYEPLVELSTDDWACAIAVGQTAVFLGMREAVPVMRRQKAGSIVNIASFCGSLPAAGAHGWHAAMGAVQSMSRNAAISYAACNIRVNSVLPGFILSPPTTMWSDTISRSVAEATPMKRAGRPVEVAYGCLFLASDEASFVTGSELVIDGGYRAR